MRTIRIKERRWRTAAAVCAVLVSVVFLSAAVSAADELCAGGMPFGVRFQTDGIIIESVEDVKTASGAVCPAKRAGLAPGDLILSVNGERVASAEGLIGIIADSGGHEIKLLCRRGGEERTVSLLPVKDEKGVFRAGMWVRDSAAGIGTVTFYDPETGSFAGLGHGICDSTTGELIPLVTGKVTDVTIFGVERGVAGTPGELKGYFGSRETGTICKNSVTGVYGTFDEAPDGAVPAKVIHRDEVKTGDAIIRCTLADGKMRDYTARISEIDHGSRTSKSFVITITDKALIDATGGIVQGMSGSPVFQDGGLVGAVTHVMINDPTRGYGIFIDNMLENMPAA